MKFLEVDLTNIRTFKHVHYKVPRGLSLLTGPNGSGKSTLLGIAAAWALWGVVPGRSQDYLVRRGEREMVAEIAIASGGRQYLIRRRFLLAKSGKGGTTQLTLTDNEGHDLTGAINKDTQASINEVCGSFEVWSITAYVSQREGAGQFLQANAYERKTILREIIAGAGNWDEWEGVAKTHAAKAGVAINRIEGALPAIEEEAGKLGELKELLKTTKSEQDVVATALDYVEADLEITQNALADQQEEIAAWQRLQDAVEPDRKEWDRENETLKRIDEGISKNKDLPEKLPNLEAALVKQNDTIAIRRTEILDVEVKNNGIMGANAKAKGKYDALNAHYLTDSAAWADEVQRIDTENNADDKRAQEVVAETIKIEEAEISLRDNVCVECKQPLNDEHTEELRQLVDGDYNWRKTRAAAELVITDHEDFTHEDAPVQPEVPTNAAYLPLPATLVANEALQSNLVEARSASAFLERLVPVREVAVETVDTAKQKWQYSVACAEEAGEKPVAESQEQAVTDAKTRVGDAREAQTKNATDLGVVAGQEAAAARATELLTVTREDLAAEKVTLHQWELTAQMCGTNGIRQLIIDQSLGAMESASNRWLQIIAPGFEIAFSTQTETDRETFEEGVIMPSGAIQPWSELSGAQSVAVALAVRMGLAELGGAAQGIHYGTLYLDEADSWLTGEYQQQFMDMLNRVADTGIDVVAITHIESVQDMVDQQTRVVPIDSETSEVR